MKKPKYIRVIEKNNKVLSLSKLYSLPKEFDDFITKKVIILYSKSDIDNNNGKFLFKEKIYRTMQGFYLYLSFRGDVIDVDIYYYQEQHNELIIFITQLLKQFKNATTNDGRN
jgi:hypothetical protein